MDQKTKEEGKTMAIISYLTIIGLIVAYFMNTSKKNEFASFHIGQSLRIVILAIIINIVLRIVISLTGIGFLSILGLAPLVFFILGIINAINLKAEPLPLIGKIGAK